MRSEVIFEISWLFQLIDKSSPMAYQMPFKVIRRVKLLIEAGLVYKDIEKV